MALAFIFTAIMALLIVFQLTLASGVPWGRFAWGGQYPEALPTGYRVASVFSALVYGLMIVFALDLAGVVDVVPNAVSQVGMWVIFGFLAFSVLMNAFSRSKPERYVMTPIAIILAVFAFFIALTGPATHSFAGWVLDVGHGTRLCTIVLESYPPQCGADSLSVAGWDWTVVEHEQSQSRRWGYYRFDGVRDNGTITITGAVTSLG